MRSVILWGLASSLAASRMPVVAQEAVSVGDLEKQLRVMQENLLRQQRQMESLQQQINLLRQRQSTPDGVDADAEAKLSAAESDASEGSGFEAEPAPAEDRPEPGDVDRRWRPTDPIRLAGNQDAYLDLSLIGLFAAGGSTARAVDELQLGAHDPQQRGFTVQNLETTFKGMVDPYFRGEAAIIYQIDREGESFIEVEEAYLETLALPWNLQVKGGQYFTEFGRLNRMHPHAWDFVDQPLINGRLFGGDGLRAPGARVSWLTPTPFYSELFFSVQNSQGETAFSFRNENEGDLLFGRPAEQGEVRSLDDLLFAPRYAVSLDLTDTQTLVAGTSAAFGPNGSGPDADTQIYGVDLYWKWKPADHSKGFPFVSWQTEAMLRRYEAGSFTADLDGSGTLDAGEPDVLGDGATIYAVPRETLKDWGFYSQWLYGFRPGWVAGFRMDYVAGDRAGYETLYGEDEQRSERWRFSPNLTWYLTEFSKVRLQYNYDDRDGLGEDHSVWLQSEFSLGKHGAHQF